MPKWIEEGKIKDAEYVVDGGLPHAGQAFVDMMVRLRGPAVICA